MRSRSLINGFVRKIDASLKNKIIPYEINELCFLFYFTSNVLYYFCRIRDPNKNGLYIYDIDNNQNFQCKIFDINTSKLNSTSESDAGAIGYTSPYIAKNISSNIFHKLNSSYLNKSKAYSYDIIFKCGGNSDANGDSSQCQAIIFNSSQLDTNMSADKNQTLTAYHYELPSLPVKMWGTTAVYSHVNGLYNIGGSNCTKIYNLNDPFNSNSKWNCVATFDSQIAYTSSVFINDYQLFICGGTHDYNGIATTQILNTNSYDWVKLNDCINKRQCAGILYDNNHVYIGGGDDTNHSVEYYDLIKQRWCKLVSTNCEYAFCPTLWISHNENNMLYIAGIKSNAIEVLDLRIGKQWEIVYGNKKNLLQSKFDTPLLYQHRSWLLC
eukprot:216030_1